MKFKPVSLLIDVLLMYVGVLKMWSRTLYTVLWKSLTQSKEVFKGNYLDSKYVCSEQKKT